MQAHVASSPNACLVPNHQTLRERNIADDPRFKLSPRPGKRVYCSLTNIVYELVEQVGSGAAAVVFRCHRVLPAWESPSGGEVVDRSVDYAVKILNLRSLRLRSDYQREREKLRREVSILRKLHHPGIVNLLHVIETEDELFFIMEMVKGGELFYKIVERGCLSEDETRYILIQLLHALQYMHQKNVIHRDLKPENILIAAEPATAFYHVRIADFGLAKLVCTGYSEAKSFVGTPQYWAPEVIDSATGKSIYGAPADLWSLGCVIYVMLGGSYPFDSRLGRIDVLIKNAQFHFRYPRFQNVSDDAKDLICGLLTVDPEKRYTVSDVLCHRWMQSFQSQLARFPPLPGLTPIPSHEVSHTLQISPLSVLRSLSQSGNIVTEMNTSSAHEVHSTPPVPGKSNLPQPQALAEFPPPSTLQSPQLASSPDPVVEVPQVSVKRQSIVHVQQPFWELGNVEAANFATAAQARHAAAVATNVWRQDAPFQNWVASPHPPSSDPQMESTAQPAKWNSGIDVEHISTKTQSKGDTSACQRNRTDVVAYTSPVHAAPFPCSRVAVPPTTASGALSVNASQVAFNGTEKCHNFPVPSSNISNASPTSTRQPPLGTSSASPSVPFDSMVYRDDMLSVEMATKTVFKFEELLCMQMSVMRKLHWVSMALRHYPEAGRQLKPCISQGRELQLHSIHIVRQFETTCSSVLALVPDISFAVAQQQANLAGEFLEDMRSWTVELKTEMAYHQKRVALLLRALNAATEAVRFAKNAMDRHLTMNLFTNNSCVQQQPPLTKNVRNHESALLQPSTHSILDRVNSEIQSSAPSKRRGCFERGSCSCFKGMSRVKGACVSPPRLVSFTSDTSLRKPGSRAYGAVATPSKQCSEDPLANSDASDGSTWSTASQDRELPPRSAPFKLSRRHHLSYFRRKHSSKCGAPRCLSKSRLTNDTGYFSVRKNCFMGESCPRTRQNVKRKARTSKGLLCATSNSKDCEGIPGPFSTTPHSSSFEAQTVASYRSIASALSSWNAEIPTSQAVEAGDQTLCFEEASLAPSDSRTLQELDASFAVEPEGMLEQLESLVSCAVVGFLESTGKLHLNNSNTNSAISPVDKPCVIKGQPAAVGSVSPTERVRRQPSQHGAVEVSRSRTRSGSISANAKLSSFLSTSSGPQEPPCQRSNGSPSSIPSLRVHRCPDRHKKASRKPRSTVSCAVKQSSAVFPSSIKDNALLDNGLLKHLTLLAQKENISSPLSVLVTHLTTTAVAAATTAVASQEHISDRTALPAVAQELIELFFVAPLIASFNACLVPQVSTGESAESFTAEPWNFLMMSSSERRQICDSAYCAAGLAATEPTSAEHLYTCSNAAAKTTKAKRSDRQTTSRHPRTVGFIGSTNRLNCVNENVLDDRYSVLNGQGCCASAARTPLLLKDPILRRKAPTCYTRVIRVLELLLKALDELRRMTHLLKECSSFWLNISHVVDHLGRMKTQIERLLRYSMASPGISERFFERLRGFRGFWRVLRDQAHHYVTEAEHRLSLMDDFAFALGSTADRLDTALALRVGKGVSLLDL